MDKTSLEAAGWECVDVGGFAGRVGPFWRREGEAVELGLIVAEHHCNTHLGTVHGGVVMTMADIALGYGVAKALGDAQRYNTVTISLQTQFVAVARIGEFISCQPEVIKRGKQMVFVRGLIKTDEKTVATAEGIWKLLGN